MENFQILPKFKKTASGAVFSALLGRFLLVPQGVYGVQAGGSDLGEVYAETGGFDLAQRQLTESVEIFTGLENLWGVIINLFSLGKVALAHGDCDGARRLFTDTLEKSEETAYWPRTESRSGRGSFWPSSPTGRRLRSAPVPRPSGICRSSKVSWERLTGRRWSAGWP